MLTDKVSAIGFNAIGTGILGKALLISFSFATTILNYHIYDITYKSITYISGRRVNLAFQTYRDESMTQPYKYYEEIKKGRLFVKRYSKKVLLF